MCLQIDETCKDIHYFQKDWEIIKFNACSSIKPNGSKTETRKKTHVLLICVSVLLATLMKTLQTICMMWLYKKTFSQISFSLTISLSNVFVIKAPRVDNWEHWVQYYRNKVSLYSMLRIRRHQPRAGHTQMKLGGKIQKPWL